MLLVYCSKTACLKRVLVVRLESGCGVDRVDCVAADALGLFCSAEFKIRAS